MATFAQRVRAEAQALPQIDITLPDADVLAAFRAFWLEAHLRNPAAFVPYSTQYAAAVSAPCDRRHMGNVRKARAAERKARRWFQRYLNKDVGDKWRLTERDWAGFFAALIEFFNAIAPLFAMCGV